MNYFIQIRPPGTCKQRQISFTIHQTAANNAATHQRWNSLKVSSISSIGTNSENPESSGQVAYANFGFIASNSSQSIGTVWIEMWFSSTPLGWSDFRTIENVFSRKVVLYMLVEWVERVGNQIFV